MRTKRLTQCSMEYLSILFIIWQLVSYYGVLFHIDAGDNPAETPAKLLQKNGISYVRLSFPKTVQCSFGCKIIRKMKRVYNEYLRYSLLPTQNILKPFSAGSTIHDIMEPLYIDLVFEDETHIFLDVYYIDNLEAYNYVRVDEAQLFVEEDDEIWNF